MPWPWQLQVVLAKEEVKTHQRGQRDGSHLKRRERMRKNGMRISCGGGRMGDGIQRGCLAPKKKG